MIPGRDPLAGAVDHRGAGGGLRRTAPTAAILPSRISTEPRSMRSPVAVSTVALVIRTVCEGRGW